MKKILYCVVFCSLLAPSFLFAPILLNSMSREAIILTHLSDKSLVKKRILAGEVKPFLPILNLFTLNIHYVTDDPKKALEKIRAEEDKDFKENLLFMQECLRHEWGLFDKEIKNTGNFELFQHDWVRFIKWTCYKTLCKEYDMYVTASESGFIVEAVNAAKYHRDDLKKALAEFRKRELKEQEEMDKVAKLLDFDSKSDTSVVNNWGIENVLPPEEMKEEK